MKTRIVCYCEILINCLFKHQIGGLTKRAYVKNPEQLGSHVSRFVPGSNSEQSIVNFSTVAPTKTSNKSQPKPAGYV